MVIKSSVLPYCLGAKGVKEVNVGLMAVFDGHNGSEASEMASELLLEYFVLHTYFLLDTTYSFLSRKLTRRLPNKAEYDAAGFQKIQWNEDIDGRILNFGRSLFFWSCLNEYIGIHITIPAMRIMKIT